MEKPLLYLEPQQYSENEKKIWWKVIDARLWVWDEFEWEKIALVKSFTSTDFLGPIAKKNSHKNIGSLSTTGERGGVDHFVVGTT